MSGKYTITRLSLTKRYPHFDGLRRSRKLCKMRCPDCKGTRHSKYNGSNMVLRRAASCRLSVRLPCICKRTAYSRNSQLTAQNHNHELCPVLPVGILYKITQMDYFTVIFLRLDHGLNTFLPFSEVLLNACIPTVQLPFGTFLNVAVTVPSLRFRIL